MKTLSERNRILNEVKDTCYLAFFDGNPEEGGKEILTGRKKVNFPVATNGYVKSTNQLDFTGGEEDIVKYGETSQKTYAGYQQLMKDGFATSPSDTNYWTISGGAELTPLENGWGRLKKISTAGGGFANFNIKTAGTKGFSASTVYTVIFEIKNVTAASGSYDIAQPSSNADPWGSGSDMTPVVGCQWRNNTNVYVALSGSTTPKYAVFKAKTKSALEGYSQRTFLRPDVEVGSTLDVRVTVLNGDHSSDWQNYCGDNYEQFVGGVPSPNPDYPQDVVNVTIGNIELCEIGDYEDYVYTENGKWYKHTEIAKLPLDENAGLQLYTGVSDTGFTFFRAAVQTPKNQQVISNYFDTSFNGWANLQSQHIEMAQVYVNNSLYLKVLASRASTLSELNTWLMNHNVVAYYVLDTPTNTEITDATTKAALEEMFGNATGVAKYWGIYDSEVGGKLLYYFVMPYEVNIVKDSTITINAGNCVLKEG